MGTFGRIAIGARGQLSYGEEVAWGIAVAPTQRLDFKTESFSNEIGNLLSEALDPSRGISKRVRGVSNISGDIGFEQNTQGYETLYKHGLGDYQTMAKVDGGVRTQLTVAFVSGGTTLTVGDSSVFEATPSTDWGLIAVYKDATTGLLTTTNITYSALATGTTITITDPAVNIPKGAWIMQRYIGADDFWDSVYTHYIEAAKDLPVGTTWEVGRDVAYFVYSGAKVNTLENTFTAQEILQGTFSFIGKGEYVGGDLYAAISAGATTLTMKNYTTTHSATINAAVFTGGGIDDATSGGTYVGTTEKHYVALISLAAATDEFDWSDDGGVTWTTGVAITGAAQALSDGVTITFAATTGHTLADQWDFVTGDIIGFNPAGSTIQIESENEITYTGVNAYNGVITGIPGSGTGSITVDHAVDVPVVPQLSWGTPTAPPETDPLSSFQAAIYVDGVAQEVLSATFTLNNNLFADKFQLGDRFRAGLPEQQRTVEGSLNVEFDDVILYKKYINGVAAFFEIRCIDDSARLDSLAVDTAPAAHWVYGQKHCILPNIEYTGTTPQIGGPDQITHDLPFTALRDVPNDMNELAIIFVNANPTI